MAEGVTNENKLIRECFGWAGAVINCPANGWNSSIMSGMGRMARSGGEQCGPLSRTTSLAARRLEAATPRDTRRAYNPRLCVLLPGRYALYVRMLGITFQRIFTSKTVFKMEQVMLCQIRSHI